MGARAAGRDTGLWYLFPRIRRGALGSSQPGGRVAKPKVVEVESWCHWEAESTAAWLGLPGSRSLPILFFSLSTTAFRHRVSAPSPTGGPRLSQYPPKPGSFSHIPARRCYLATLSFCPLTSGDQKCTELRSPSLQLEKLVEQPPGPQSVKFSQKRLSGRSNPERPASSGRRSLSRSGSGSQHPTALAPRSTYSPGPC